MQPLNDSDCRRPAASPAPYIAGIFRTLTALRGRRVFHPYGVAFNGTIVVTDRSTIIPPGRWSAKVRVSRGAGLPEPLPDVHGLAFRVLRPEGSEDVLLATVAGASPLARRVLMPTRGAHARFASLLPFGTARGRRLIGATTRDPCGSLEWLRADNPFPTFEIVEAEPAGDWHTTATLHLNRRLNDDEAGTLRFDPSRTPAQVAPAGLLNALRPSVYEESQRVRDVSEKT